jgi:Fe-S cluster assembly protein SufD
MPTWLTEIRKGAQRRFDELGYPSPKLEDWRFTNVAPIARAAFHVSPNGASRGEQFREFFLSHGARFVFVNGHFVPALSSLGGLPPGVYVNTILAALSDPVEARVLEQHLTKVAGYAEPAQSFVALNTAAFEDGVYVRIPAGTVLANPISVCFITTGDGTIANTRSLVVAGKNSQAALVETYVGNAATFTNTVTEIVAGDNAVVEHYKLQQESPAAFHIGQLSVHQGRDSSVHDHSVSLGGKLVRNDLHFVLDGQGAEAQLNGLYITNGEQHVANHSKIDHAQPHCPSRELYKGILSGKSSAVFNGGIVVRQIAQKTDAKQSNKNLLLSDDASINTKPQLEIWADDVKCTHGATIGRLDDEQLFYLRARGISEDSARDLLTFAFANELLARMKAPEVRERLEMAVQAKLEQGNNIEVLV